MHATIKYLLFISKDFIVFSKMEYRADNDISVKTFSPEDNILCLPIIMSRAILMSMDYLYTVKHDGNLK